jgi:nucleoid-associated protein YgaU
MGRDKVLGLSLAILLIGFAGAFCFRNEPFVENGLKLARAKILDDGIAKRPGPKPYVAEGKAEPTSPSKPTVTLGSIEAIEPVESSHADRQSQPETAPTPPSKPVPQRNIAKSAAPKARFVSVEKARSAPEPVSTEPGPLASSASVVDKPLELTIRPNSPAFAPPDSLLEDSLTWQHAPEGRDGCPAMTKAEPEHSATSASTTPTASTSSNTYCVRRGDTLSKIALHFLGDSNRYHEIFDANRDQLQTQNTRLKVGMTLRIPADRPRSKRPQTSAVSQSKPARTNHSASGSPRTRQVPAQPVVRTRELSAPKPSAKSSTARPSGDEPQEPMGTPRFLPVTKGPFLRSQGDSSSANSRSRDLSQRPPAIKQKDRASDGDVDGRSDRGTSSAQPRTAPKQADEKSTMDSEGSEGP